MFRIRFLKSNCLFLAFVLVFSVFSLTSCRGEDEAVESENAVIFTDALGREVKVEREPERVAALIGSFADVWMLAGGRLCASADDAWDDFGLDMGDAVNIGATKSPNVELLLASDPDFVLASASTAANVEMKDTLESVGITVAYFDVDSFEDYLEMLKICTDITGRSDLYEKNGIEVKKKIDSLILEFDSEKIPESERSVLFLRASAGYIRAKNNKGTVLGEMLADLGIVNIADTDGSLLENLSIEKIISQEPYRIFIVQVGDDAEAVKKNVERMMNENAAWKELSAVREDRVYYLDKKLFNLKPNARWSEAYEKLCSIFTK